MSIRYCTTCCVFGLMRKQKVRSLVREVFARMELAGVKESRTAESIGMATEKR